MVYAKEIKYQIEQNRCAMACQGRGAVFAFQKAVDICLRKKYC